IPRFWASPEVGASLRERRVAILSHRVEPRRGKEVAIGGVRASVNHSLRFFAKVYENKGDQSHCFHVDINLYHSKGVRLSVSASAAAINCMPVSRYLVKCRLLADAPARTAGRPESLHESHGRQLVQASTEPSVPRGVRIIGHRVGTPGPLRMSRFP